MFAQPWLLNRCQEQSRKRARDVELGPRDAAPGLPTLQTPTATRMRAEAASQKASQRVQRAQEGPAVGCGYEIAAPGHPRRLWRRRGLPQVCGQWRVAAGLSSSAWGARGLGLRSTAEYSLVPCRSRFSLSASWLNQAPGKRSTTQRPPPTSQRAAPDAPAVLREAFYCTAAVRRSQQAPCVPVMCHGRRSLAATLAAALVNTKTQPTASDARKVGSGHPVRFHVEIHPSR